MNFLEAHIGLYLQPCHENFDDKGDNNLPPLIRVPPPPTDFHCHFTSSLPFSSDDLEPNPLLEEEKHGRFDDAINDPFDFPIEPPLMTSTLATNTPTQTDRVRMTRTQQF